MPTVYQSIRQWQSDLKACKCRNTLQAWQPPTAPALYLRPSVRRSFGSSPSFLSPPLSVTQQVLALSTDTIMSSHTLVVLFDVTVLLAILLFVFTWAPAVFSKKVQRSIGWFNLMTA